MNDPKSTIHGRSPRRRVIGLTAGAAFMLCATIPALVPGAASAASAGTSNGDSGSSAAVVTPLLEFFEFGNTIGTPLICSDAGSVVSIIGVQGGAGKVSTPLVNELNSLCARVATQGNGYLTQGVTESAALSPINPVVDPLIAALANGFNSVGTDYGPSLSPFGPTVAGLGGTVAFFEGS
ncbi:MAG TPA: hypothetical protein VHV57_20435 [Acidimicrobiales bacterium]|jgi:hypothetical protein|nr:hypothetical protein [Acidimicrobiales bacterium]